MSSPQAVTFFRCHGQAHSHLCDISSRFLCTKIIQISWLATVI